MFCVRALLTCCRAVVGTKWLIVSTPPHLRWFVYLTISASSQPLENYLDECCENLTDALLVNTVAEVVVCAGATFLGVMRSFVLISPQLFLSDLHTCVCFS